MKFHKFDNDECHFSYGQLVISFRLQWNSLRSNLPICHYYYGQLVISFRSKWNSLRSNFDRTVNLFHALTDASTNNRPIAVTAVINQSQVFLYRLYLFTEAEKENNTFVCTF